ncbi:hypothetical protein RHMOL_Rhmol05G0240700 [Rhododendron molle]|uniref:Uncharacterized protein n=1 Tax=Rhododendron molle TaxID=49168 RepID=A0ACC0NU03_RHOML|nr:hypothetical protein RHMOL_Rhmol05G0240700 [Rhododendron molle]
MGPMVISLPVILLLLIIALACYIFGRAQARSQAARASQYYGPPAPCAPPQGAPQSHGPVK